MLLLLALGVTLGGEWWRSRDHARLARAVTATALAVAAATPVFLQYRAMQERHGFTRGRREAMAWSARPRSYLEPGTVAALPHTAALSRFARDGEPLFPGSWALIFGLWGLVRFVRTREGALAAAWTAVGFALSLGPIWMTIAGREIAGPFELFRLLPGGALLRTPSRLGVLAVLGLDVLAAMAWSRALGSSRRHTAWVAGAAAWILLEAFPAGLRDQIREMPRPPASVAWLAAAERGVVLELPWTRPADSALYLYWSTGHWQVMVNGFGSFDPPGNAHLGVVGHGWPSVYAAKVFRDYGVRYVVVHRDRLTPKRRERLETAALPNGVRLGASLGDAWIYEILPL